VEGGVVSNVEMTSTGFKATRESGISYGAKLRDAVETYEKKNWPTATTRDWKDTTSTVPPSRANPSKQTLGQRVAHVGLLDQANPSTTGKSQGSWSTPQARDWKGPEGRAYKGQTKDLPSQTEAQGKLNPDWVESLMGLPVGWTDLGSWATE